LRLQVITPSTDDLMSLAISPDGQRIAFVASADGKAGVWIRPLESVTAQPVPGTDGAAYPFWSPDSRSIGFFADGKLKRIDIAGGPARELANASIARGGTWNRDGVIVFSAGPASPLLRVSATGGGLAVPVTKLDTPQQTGHRFPQFLPDGKHFVFASLGNQGGQGLYLASLDSTQIQRLFDADSQAIFVPPGYLIFMRQGILLQQQFDLSTFRPSGEPIAIAENISSDLAILVGAFSYGGGILGYRAGTASSGRQLVWLDRSGKAVGSVGNLDKNNLFNPNLAPGGQSVAFNRQVSGNIDVWLLETTRGILTRFTVDAATDRGPVWSPDGTRIVFASNRNGTQDLYEKPLGGGMEKLLISGNNTKLPLDWSPDGRFILYREVDQTGGYDLLALPTFGDGKPIAVAKTPFEERDGQFSPDGRWVAYRSNESGRFEVYVQPFPGPGGNLQISTNGGTQPRWRRDGKEVFYISLDNKLMSLPVATSSDGKTIKPEPPTPLFSVSMAGGPMPATNNQQYSVSRDGQRFLVNLATDEASTPITLVLNWNPRREK
jgi:Tol biopolymer transport system component